MLAIKADLAAQSRVEPSKPNFFLLGPPKCATTAIAHKLSLHPDVFFSSPKEPQYFVFQGGNPFNWPARGRDELHSYLDMFKDAVGSHIVAEGSTAYFAAPHVPGLLAKFNPDAKLLVVLRNPIFRAISMYRYWHSNSAHRATAKEFVRLFRTEGLANEFELHQAQRMGWLKDTGYYARHLSRYLGFFPKDQVKVVFYTDILNDFRSVYADIFAFLGIRPIPDLMLNNAVENRTSTPRSAFLQGVLNIRNHPLLLPVTHSLRETKIGEALKRLEALNRTFEDIVSTHLSPEMYSELIETYSDDISVLEKLTGRNLEGWRAGTLQ